MKSSTIKLICLNTIFLIVLFLDCFVWNILNYKTSIIFYIILILIFKYTLGFEKDNHRYIMDNIINIIILFLAFFILYYVSGIFIGFIRTDMLYSTFGLLNILIPYILIVILKEFLRYQILTKSNKSKLLIIFSFICFTLFDIILTSNITSLINRHDIFILFATKILPSISINIVASYIAIKLGYKPNILWILILTLYPSLLPIVPDSGIYLTSMLNFLFPFILMFIIYNFFIVRKKDIITRESSKFKVLPMILCFIFIFFIIYLTSGYFKYYSLAIATGSMHPNIKKGDIVIVDQKFKLEDLEVGKVIAYKYQNKIVVHRLSSIDKYSDEYFFYTKGDANNCVDNYIIYYDTIIGIVDLVVPYLGYPTVWLNEL